MDLYNKILRGTSKLCLCFGDTKPFLEGFSNVDMAKDLDGRKSTSTYLFTFVRGSISWQFKLQKCVALSTTKLEYITTTETTKEMLWMKKVCFGIGFKSTNLCDLL